MSINYKGFKIEKSQGIDFGHPTFKKYGKEYDIQEYIEAGREDTEIKVVLEKYGCLKPLEKDISGIYADFTEYNDLRTTLDKAKKANNMWAEMPVDIKNEFNNSIEEFIDRGQEWAKRKMEKMSKPAEQPVEKPIEQSKGDE